MPDHEAVELFTRGVENLEGAVMRAIRVSQCNIGVKHTGRQNRSLFLFAKLIAHAMSLLKITSVYDAVSAKSTLLDHFAAASIARMIMDASLMTMYISHPTLTRDEWNLRRYLFYLHDICNRRRYLKHQTEDNDEQYSDFVIQKDDFNLKIKLFANRLSLPNETLPDLVSGQRVFVNGVRGAVREAGWDIKGFDALQSYLSAHIHSHPVSFMRADTLEISFEYPSNFQIGCCGEMMSLSAEFLDKVRTRMDSFCASFDHDPLGQVDD